MICNKNKSNIFYMLTTVNESELREILEITPPEQNNMIAGKHGIGK